jgi:hypothetical protein
MNYYNSRETNTNDGAQSHVHEFLGTVKLADGHTHRFAGISSEEIPVPGGHVHEVSTKTDFYEDHYHELGGRSGLQIPVGNDRHVHFAKATTTLNDGHVHQFQFAALINDPIGE